jgi:type IV pilus secretin PilQ/predicted competence protein
LKRSVLSVFAAALVVLVPLSAAAQTAKAEPRAAVVQDLSYGDDNASRDESSLYKEVEANSPLDRKVTIRVNNVPIGTFLNSISVQSKINFIMGEEFAGKKVSASLSNVTVREALDTLLRVQGLTYQRIGKSDSYVITKRSDEAPNAVTKVYTLNYVSLQGQSSAAQSLNSLMPQDVTSSAISSGGSSHSGGFSSDMGGGLGGGIGGGISMGGGSSGGGGGENSQSAILDIIKSVLTKQGKIAIDGRTNKLIITDVAEVFPQVENILAELDVKAPQILIEAQIVEVSKSSGFDVGFTWGGENGAMGQFTGGSKELPWSYFTSNPSGGILKWFSTDGDPTSGDPMKLDFTMFSVLFNAIMTNGEARSLGKPKVITMNNNAAVITSSREAAVSTVTRTDGGGSSTSQTSGVERRRVGLTLTVTPQVNKEGYVTLTVAPSYSDLVASETGQGNWDTVTRAVSTQVRVRSGQTVVLGGLLQSTEKESVSKVPFLGQIPVVGWLFTSKQKSKSTTDLIIFLTPTVLSE